MDIFRTKKVSKNVIILGILFSVLASYFLFGSYHLTKYVTTDEQFWVYDRIPQYWKALAKQNLKKTHINDKPGVSVALFSGAGLLVSDPEKHKIQEVKTFDNYHIDQTESLYRNLRLPLFVLNGFLILYLFWIIRKISNDWIALWSSIFIALSPILLGISRIINPDALLWSFSAAAIFTYLALLKEPAKKLVFLTALFTGLALLSKYVANILFVFFLVSLLANLLANFQKNPVFLRSVKDQVRNYLLIFLGSLAVFSILMPSVFLKSAHLIEGTIGFSGIKPFVLPIALFLAALFVDARFLGGKFIFPLLSSFKKYQPLIFRSFFVLLFILFSLTALNWISQEKIISLSHIPIDARTSDVFTEETSLLEKMLLETYPFIFSLTPLSFLLILWAWLMGIFAKKEHGLVPYVFSISLSIMIFLIGGIMSGLLLTPRYMIMLFPLAGFLSAIGLYFIIEKYASKKNYIFYLATAIIFLASLVSLWQTKPFYYSYASSLLPQKYVLSNAWGFGGYEAAQYLNSLPDSGSVTVWSDYRGVCEFTYSDCIIHRKFDKELFPIDYYVLTRRGQSRSDYALLNQFEQAGIEPEWEIFIDGRPDNYVKIFKNGSDEK